MIASNPHYRTCPIGLAALSVLELTPPQMVACAAQAGFDLIGLRLIAATPEEPQHPMVGDTPLVRETLRELEDTGMQCLDIEIFRLHADTRVAEFRAALETGARLGAREALVAGNDAVESRLVANFAAFCDLAAEFGIAANIEPMPWTDCADFASGVRIVNAAGRDNAGVLIDPIHFDRGGSEVGEIAGLAPSRLRYLQLCDAPALRLANREGLLYQARAERLMPGDGGLDLAGIRRAAPPGIPVSLEIPMHALAKTMPALDRAKQMLAKTRRLLASL